MQDFINFAKNLINFAQISPQFFPNLIKFAQSNQFYPIKSLLGDAIQQLLYGAVNRISR